MKILKKVKEIRSSNGKLHFTRFAIIESKWFSIYIHKLYAKDEDAHLHDHPWSFFNIVLKGTYVEQVLPSLDKGYNPDVLYLPKLNTRGPGAMAYRRAERFHKINEIVDGPVVTLNFMGRRRRTWGYLINYDISQSLEYGSTERIISFSWMDFKTYRNMLRSNNTQYTLKLHNITPAKAEQQLREYLDTQCWCLTCRPLSINDMRFVVCPDCGNKRCPKANFHDNECTKSNETGQKGSAYEHIPGPKMLFLDDWREPAICTRYMSMRVNDASIYNDKNWIIVRSYGQFIQWITKNGLPDIISFDHDLGDVDELKETLPVEEWFDLEGNKEYTGMDCAKWLVDYCLDNDLNMPDYLVHSDNPAGRDNINGLLASYNKMRNKTTE